MQRTSISALAPATLLLCVAFAAGCSSSEAPSPGPESGASEAPSSAKAAAAPRRLVACELLTPDEIGRLLGRTVYSTLPTEDPVYCMWSTRAAPGIIGDVRLSLDPNPVEAGEAIRRMVERGGTRIEGLGSDAAVELRRAPDFYKLVSLVGGTLVEVSVFGDPARVQAEQVIALARLVASRL